MVVSLQLASGAYGADFDSHPDEPAHFVTGVMVHSYLRETLLQFRWTPPMEFARAYYARYPKVALGHWPPMYYVAQQPLFLLGGTTRAAALWLNACAGAALLLLIWRESGGWAGVCAAAAFCLFPHTRVAANTVMADLFTALAICLAAAAWIRYLHHPGWKRALLFGLLAAVALLSKGTAVMLAILPLTTVLLTRRFDLPLRWDFWLSAVPVLAFAGPWYLFARQFGRASAGLGHRAGVLQAQDGDFPVVLALELIALAWLLHRKREPVLAGWAALLIAFLAAPYGMGAMAEPRHFLPGVAAAAIVAGMSASRVPWGWTGMAALAAVLAFQNRVTPLPLAQFRGHNLPYGRVLVTGGANLEGSLIAAYAEREPTPQRPIFRGTKLLAAMGWNGEDYQPFVDSAEGVTAILVQRRVEVVVLNPNWWPHDRLVREALKQPGWSLQKHLGRSQIYRRIQ
jgi:hypothetical protein